MPQRWHVPPFCSNSLRTLAYLLFTHPGIDVKASEFESRVSNLEGRVCVVGIGNALRGDDGAGPAVVASLSSSEHILCIDAGPAPENYAETVARFTPDHVVLVDAADFGGRPGEVRLLPASRIAASSLSCHAASLYLLARYLETRSACQTHLLAIQPASTEFMCPLSPPVDRAVRACTEALEAGLQRG